MREHGHALACACDTVSEGVCVFDREKRRQWERGQREGERERERGRKRERKREKEREREGERIARTRKSERE